MKAPVGADVGLYMDTAREINIGDEIVTRSGRRYLVTSVRQQLRGKAIGRWHLRCTILAPDAVHDDPDARVHMLFWYSRG